MLELVEMAMNKKVQRKTGIQRQVFKNLADIFHFEYGLMKKEETMVTVGTPVSTIKNYQKVSYYNPKTKDFTRIDPNNPEQVEYVTKKGMILGTEQLKNELEEIPKKLVKNPEFSYTLETEPIVFEAKGKTPPSVPYIRVFVESSLGTEESIHFVHNKTKYNKQ